MKNKEKAICWECGESREVNTYGICLECWDALPFLRESCEKLKKT